MDTAPWSGEKCPDVGPFMVGGVIPDDMDDAFVGVARLDFGEKLGSADPIDRGWLNKGRVEGFEVQCAMDVHPSAPCRGFDSRV